LPRATGEAGAFASQENTGKAAPSRRRDDSPPFIRGEEKVKAEKKLKNPKEKKKIKGLERVE